MTGDPVDASPPPEPAKKARKPRPSESAPDDKVETAEEEPLQVAEENDSQAEDKGTDQTSAATTSQVEEHKEEHKTEPQAAADPAKQSGTGSDEGPKSRSGAGLMRFRRKRK